MSWPCWASIMAGMFAQGLYSRLSGNQGLQRYPALAQSISLLPRCPWVVAGADDQGALNVDAGRPGETGDFVAVLDNRI